MHERLFFVYYLFLLLCMFAGRMRYRHLDGAMRFVVILLFTSAFFELVAYLSLKAEKYTIKSVSYHVSSVVEIILVTQFFLTLIKPLRYAILVRISYIAWPLLGILNAIFLQPVGALNTNMLVVESFSIITMCLYTIYLSLKMNAVDNIFFNPHFWICILWLVFWSGTFFFWSFIKVLYQNGWKYMDLVLNLQIIINIILYAGIATVLFLYPKMKTIEYR